MVEAYALTSLKGWKYSYHRGISIFQCLLWITLYIIFCLPFWDPCLAPLLWQVSGYILVEALSNLLSDAKLLEERQEAAKQAYHSLSCGITENVWSFLDFHIFRVALANKGLMLWILSSDHSHLWLDCGHVKKSIHEFLHQYHEILNRKEKCEECECCSLLPLYIRFSSINFH